VTRRYETDDLHNVRPRTQAPERHRTIHSNLLLDLQHSAGNAAVVELVSRGQLPGGAALQREAPPDAGTAAPTDAGTTTAPDAGTAPAKPARKPAGDHGTHDGVRYVVYQDEVRAGGARPWRTNNPGSLDYHSQSGSLGSDGRLAIFPDHATGRQALEKLLKDNYASKTIRKAMEKYAPKEDGNDTEAYIRFIEDHAGLKRGDGDTVKVSEHLNDVADAIETMEGTTAGDTYTCASSPPAWVKPLLGCQ
jgi:hypothetical protein